MALSTLVTHIITVVLEMLQLEDSVMIFVEDQVQYVLLINIYYNNCFIYSTLPLNLVTALNGCQDLASLLIICSSNPTTIPCVLQIVKGRGSIYSQ